MVDQIEPSNSPHMAYTAGRLDDYSTIGWTNELKAKGWIADWA